MFKHEVPFGQTYHARLFEAAARDEETRARGEKTAQALEIERSRLVLEERIHPLVARDLIRRVHIHRYIFDKDVEELGRSNNHV